MKKIVLIVAAMVAGLSLSAQQKGDMYVSGTLNLGLNSIGVHTGVTVNDLSSSSNSTVNLFNFGIAPKFGYFVADNLEVNVALRYDLGVVGLSGKSKDNNGTVTKADPTGMNTNTFVVNPGVSYYVPLIAGKFYYVPSFGLGLGFANATTKEYVENVGTQSTTTDPNFAFGLYLDLAAFEYKLNENMGLTMSIGGLSYVMGTDSQKETFGQGEYRVEMKSTSTTHNVDFGFGKVALGFKYYF